MAWSRNFSADVLGLWFGSPRLGFKFVSESPMAWLSAVSAAFLEFVAPESSRGDLWMRHDPCGAHPARRCEPSGRPGICVSVGHVMALWHHSVMRSAKAWVAATLAFAWVLMALHCPLTALSLGEVAACCHAEETSGCPPLPHSDSSSDSSHETCCPVEQGIYLSCGPSLRVAVPSSGVPPPMLAWVRSCGHLASVGNWWASPIPPDWIPLWQISLRATASPRAPTIPS